VAGCRVCVSGTDTVGRGSLPNRATHGRKERHLDESQIWIAVLQLAAVGDKLGSGRAEQRRDSGDWLGLAAVGPPGCGIRPHPRCRLAFPGVRGAGARMRTVRGGIVSGARAAAWLPGCREWGANRVRAARRGSIGLRTVGELDHKAAISRLALDKSENKKEIS
jgi:hypothetical protein